MYITFTIRRKLSYKQFKGFSHFEIQHVNREMGLPPRKADGILDNNRSVATKAASLRRGLLTRLCVAREDQRQGVRPNPAWCCLCGPGRVAYPLSFLICKLRWVAEFKSPFLL